MSKRFTATEKWQDPWFCHLSERDRLFWLFLLDTCDHAGIWQVNELVVQAYFPGYVLDPSKFSDRIRIITPEKWFIRKFISFQYGELNPDSRPHASVLERLRKEGVSKGLAKSSHTLKDKDKDKDKAKAKEKAVPLFTFKEIWDRYPRQDGRKEAERYFNASVKTLDDWQRINRALGNYLLQIRNEAKDPRYIKMGSTWFNNWQDEIYQQGVPNAPHGGTSISEQVAKRLRESGPETDRNQELSAGAILARVRNLPTVQDQTGTLPGRRNDEDGNPVGPVCDEDAK